MIRAESPPPGEGGQERRTVPTQIVHQVEDSGAEMFHTEDHVPFVSFVVSDHTETWPLRSRAFRRWITGLYYAANDKAPGSQAVQDALAVLEAKALFDGPQMPVHVRLAYHQGGLYLDLGGHDWSAVRISPKGWEVVTNSPVRFRRPAGLCVLPAPVPGGDVTDLWAFANVAEADRALFEAALVAMFHPTIAHPVIVLLGEQGSAKTTAARVLRDLVDPNAAPVRSEPRDVRDLMIAATNGWIVALDNISRLPDWLSDAICRLSTGGGFATRELYTDQEEVIFDVRRPVILNGITEFATRGDLLDRASVLYLPPIPEDRRRPESELWSKFELARPQLLGALLNAVSFGLARERHVRLTALPRMADFAQWAVACGPALGLADGEFMSAYTRNRGNLNDLALEGSPIDAPLRELLASKVDSTGVAEWIGTASELVAALTTFAPEELQRSRAWPRSARAMSGELRRIGPNLRRVGIAVELPEDRGRSSSRREFRLLKEQARDQPSSSLQRHSER